MIHIEPLEPRRLFSAGHLDPSFGTAGVITRTGGADIYSRPTDLDVAVTGDIVLTALLKKRLTPTTIATSVSLWRMVTDGGDIGISDSSSQVLIPLPDDVTNANSLFNSTDAHTVLTPDGGAIVNIGYRLYRITSRGKFDRTFAHGGGATFTDFPATSDMSVDVDAQGRIYVAGDKVNRANPGNFPHHVLLFRLNPDGSIDRTFADHGVFVPPISTYNPAFDVKVLSGGKIMLAGNAGPDAVAIRLNADGSLDSSYASGGIADDDFQDNDLDSRQLNNRGIAADGSVAFTITDTFDEGDSSSRSMEFLDPDGSLIESPQPDASLVATDGPLLRDKNSVIALTGAGPAFYDPTTLQPLQAATDAAVAATALASGDGGAYLTATANDGSLLVVTSTGGVRPDLVGNSLKIRRLFSDDGPAAEARADELRSSGPGSYRFKIQYHADGALDPSTFGNDDITVTLPTGQHRNARLLSVTEIDFAGTDYLANYLLTAPDASWDPNDNGPYTIRINRRAVRDTTGHATAQRNIGVFYVNIANFPTP